jgi:membrane associated rhomboid family serine protease
MSFGPGPLSTALKGLIAANVLLFFAQLFTDQYAWGVTSTLGLLPADVISHLRLWQVATYMFLHAGVLHIVFNMLALWMFGTELERIWGTRYFLKFYFVTGIGAGALTVLFSLLPLGFAQQIHGSIIIGASGAIYGLLLAYGMYFPDRPLYLFFAFPVPAKYAVMIFGAMELAFSIGGVSGSANVTHLGGLIVAYIFLKSGRMHPLSELKYRYLKWKINRTRAKFDVYTGGRANDWDRRVH